VIAKWLGTDIPPSELKKLIGRRCLVGIKEDSILSCGFFEEQKGLG